MLARASTLLLLAALVVCGCADVGPSSPVASSQPPERDLVVEIGMPTSLDARDVPRGASLRMGDIRFSATETATPHLAFPANDQIVVAESTLTRWSLDGTKVGVTDLVAGSPDFVSCGTKRAFFASLDRVGIVDLMSGRVEREGHAELGDPIGRRLRCSPAATVVAVQLASEGSTSRCFNRLTESFGLGATYCVPDAPDGRVLDLALTDDRVFVLGALRDKSYQLAVIDARTRSKIASTEVAPARRLAIAQSGARLALGDGFGSSMVSIRDEELREIARIPTESSKLVLSFDGRHLAVEHDSTITVWDIELRRPLWRRIEPLMEHCELQFSPDGAKLGAMTDALARVFDTQTGAEVTESRGLRTIDGVALSADGTRAALAVNGASRLVLYDVSTGVPQRVLKLPRPDKEAKPRGWIWGMSFGIADETVVVGDQGGITVVDLASGTFARQQRSFSAEPSVERPSWGISTHGGDWFILCSNFPASCVVWPESDSH